MDINDRVVVLIDMDCFYCQVEEKLNPELKGKPIAVVQYNPWKGGGIIAVNYVARGMGVTRHMRGDEAKEKCPEIQLPSVPCSRGKADITKYRDAGKDVAKVLQKFTPLLERASIDEAYLDITEPVQERIKTSNFNNVNPNVIPNTHALGYETVIDFISDVDTCNSESIDFDYNHSRQLLAGAVIVSEIRKAVFEETGFSCSAGIAHNKILAKLVCGMNKPNKQTILPKHSINILYKTLSLTKVKHLGGKFGRIVCETLKISNMGDLQQFSEKKLQNKFDEKNGTWLYNIARGIDVEPVQARFNPKSIGCCKQFKGKAALLDLKSVKMWLKDLGDEIEDRLEKDLLENNRTPKQMVVSFSTQLPNGSDTSSSRSYNFGNDDDLCGELFSTKAIELIMGSTERKIKDEESNQKLNAPIKFLGISVGKFENNNEGKKTTKIVDYFGAGTSNNTKKKVLESVKCNDEKDVKSNNIGKEYILNKFLHGPDNYKEEIKKYDCYEKPILESDLDQQESFFAKFLGRCKEKCISEKNYENHSSESKVHEKIKKPQSPNCKVMNYCDEDSNDTVYTGSTINEEINKSIALFEDDPLDVDRVGKMRDLLQSNVSNDYNTVLEQKISKSNKIQESQSNANTPVKVDETVICTDCGKSIPVLMFETHADYHLALKLREEERIQFKNEVKNKVKPVTNKTKVNKLDCPKYKNESIDSFVMKIDNNVPIEVCSFCNKRVPLDKFPEHLDFHEAQKLSREINNKTPCITQISGKRKVELRSPVKKVKIPCKSIDMFFR